MAARTSIVAAGYQGLRDAWGFTADADLRWRFEASDAAVGFHAQAYEGGGGAVFDEAASHRAHMARRRSIVRDAVDRRARIDSRLARMGETHRACAVAAFTPYPWPSSVREAFRVRDTTLAGLALFTFAAQERRARAHRPGATMLEFLTWETASCASAKTFPDWLKGVRREAMAMRERALAAYEAVPA